ERPAVERGRDGGPLWRIGVQHHRGELRGGAAVDLVLGNLVEDQTAAGPGRTAGRQGSHRRVRRGQILVVEQVPVHRLLGEGEARQDGALADVPTVPGGDSAADGGQQPVERQLSELVRGRQRDPAG